MNEFKNHYVKFSHNIDEIDNLPDELGRESVARAIADELRRNIRPSMIGVYGWWGSGKSHLLSQTIKYLLDDNKNDKQQFIVCIFPAWRYEMDGDLAPGLIKSLMEVEKQFIGRNPSLSNTQNYKDIGRFILKLISTLGSSLGSIGQAAALLSKTMQIGMESIAEHEKSKLCGSHVDEIQEQMKKLVEAILNSAKETDSNGQYRLTVFIDDLDRCSPENMVRMFEWLKVHLMVEGCSYVMGLDNVAAARAIVGHYKSYIAPDEQLAYGFRYLEKLVDSEYELQLPLKVEQMALRHVYGETIKSSCLRQAICGEELKYNLGDFPGVERIDRLLDLRSLRTPRTMLKIIYKFRRVLDILVHNPHTEDLKTRLGLGYPFWALFLIAMYYRLDPDDLADFVRARGNIYRIMSNHETYKEENWDVSLTSPKWEFYMFARDFSITKTMQLPRVEELQKLAAVVHENTLTS